MFGRIFLLSLLAAGGVRAAELNSLRAWQAPDQTRVVFDLSGPVEFEVFKVSNPERVVVDLNHLNGHDALKLARVLDDRITGLRYARRGADGLRVVLQLSRAVTVKDALLPPAAAAATRAPAAAAPAGSPRTPSRSAARPRCGATPAR